jgi:hypothetical protein
MNEVLNDIDVIDKALKNLESGDIYTAYAGLTKLIIEKKDQVTQFEYEMQLQETERKVA